MPESDTVRIEEMINYFPYDYAPAGAAGPRHCPRGDNECAERNGFFFKMRYKLPGSDVSQLIEQPVTLDWRIAISMKSALKCDLRRRLLHSGRSCAGLTSAPT